MSRKKVKVKKKVLDPEKLPKPIDIHGYDGSMIRIVPEIDGLIESVIKLPKHQWKEVLNQVQDWPDIDLEEDKGRIIRRGQKNKATNIFIDSE